MTFNNIFLQSSSVNNENTSVYWPTIEWRTKTPEEMNISSNILEDMDSFIADQYYGLDSFLLIKDGYIVKENYFLGYNKDFDHICYSVSKSVTSAIVGIAIDKGYLSLNDYVIDFFPNKLFTNMDSRKSNMTVKHLLQMRSGLEWDEWNSSYSDSSNLYRQLMVSSDWVKFVLDMKMVSDPGSKFVYHSGLSYLLLAIVQQRINVTVLDFANKFLFKPIGISLNTWTTCPNNIPIGGSGLFLTPQDMARFGFLYLNNGTWNGSQIISSQWVQESIYQYHQLDWEDAFYGYQWWIEPERYGYFGYSARGYLGQYILVIPDLNLIIVCTGESSNLDYPLLITNFVLPALKNNIGTFSSAIIFPLDFLIIVLGFIYLRKKKYAKTSIN